MTKRDAGFTLIELLIVVAVIAVLAAIAVPNFLEAQVRSKISRVRIDQTSLAASLQAYYSDYLEYPRNHPSIHAFLQRCADSTAIDERTAKTPDDSPVSWLLSDPGFARRPMNQLIDESMLVGMGSRRGYEGTFSPSVDEATTDTVAMIGDESTTMTLDPSLPGDAMVFAAPSSGCASPAYQVSGYDLVCLTTPVAYLTGRLPIDMFSSQRTIPFPYVNFSALRFADASSAAHRGARFALYSPGPDTDDVTHYPGGYNPVRGPFISYDVTNGTVSSGDIHNWGN